MYRLRSDARAAPPGAWRAAIRGNVLVLGLVSLFTDISSEMIYPLLPVFLSGLVPLGLAALYVGIMEGVAEATASLLKLFSGRVSDALGRRKLLAVLGYGISTAARPVIALAGAGWQVIALRFTDRVGKGIRTSPRDALISHSAPSRYHGLAFSFHRAMDHAGAVLGPLFAIGFLYLALGRGLWRGSTTHAGPDEMEALRWLFALALLPGLLAVSVLATRARDVVMQRAASEPRGDPDRTRRRLPRRFYGFVGAVTLFALGNSSDLFLVFYGQVRFGLDLLQVVVAWMALHLSKIVFSLPGGALSDRLGRRPLIVSGWLVYALVYLGMAVSSQAWQFWGLFVTYGLYYGLTEGAEKALVADFVAADQRGTAYGVYHAAVGVAALPASLLFGVFWSIIGPAVAFGIGAGLAALATGVLLLLPRAHPARAA